MKIIFLKTSEEDKNCYINIMRFKAQLDLL